MSGLPFYFGAAFHALTANVPDTATFIVTPDLRIVYAEGLALQAYFTDPSDLVGKHLSETIGEPGYGVFEALYRAALRGERASGKYGISDGRSFQLDAIPVAGPGGDVAAAMLVARDITESKRLERNLRDSETRYRAIIQDQTELICLSDRNGIITFVNEAYCRFYNRTCAQMIGQSLLVDLPPEARREVQSIFNRLDREHPFSRNENVLIRHDGERRWFSWVNRAIFSEDGEFLQIHSVGRDITDEHEAVDRLRSSESRYRNLIDALGEGILLYSSSGEIVGSNKRAAKILGMPTDALMRLDMQHSALEVVDANGQPLPPAERPVQLTFRTGEAQHNVVMGVRKPEGRLTWLLVNTVRVDTSSLLDQIAVIATFIDITERQDAMDKLKSYADQVKNANDEIQSFAYTVSHDLRAPLTDLRAFADELRHGVNVLRNAYQSSQLQVDNLTLADEIDALLSDDMPEAIDFIDNAATRLDNLTRSILKLSRMGGRPMELALVDVSGLVSAVIDLHRHQIDERKIRVSVEPLPQIFADELDLQQIFSNLLSNALKFMAPDRIGRIDIWADDTRTHTVFHIRDNGIGITPEQAPHVFEVFYRGNRAVPGEGMGLAFVQTLVRRHKGSIYFNSDPGKGTTFSFSIARELNADA